MIPEQHAARRRRFVITRSVFGFRPDQIIEVVDIIPRKGQFVAVQLSRNCFEIARYMVRHLELDNGLPLVGVMDRILGVVFKV